MEQCLDVRGIVREGESGIIAIRGVAHSPPEVLLATGGGLALVEIDKTYRPSFGFHPSFSTRLSTLNMLHEQRRYRIFKVAETSPLASATGQCLVDIAYDGGDLIVFCREICYFEVFSVGEEGVRLDFYSRLKAAGAGFARDIVWHQYRSQ
ncbi:unnamed protein product [Sphagnum balticum]